MSDFKLKFTGKDGSLKSVDANIGLYAEAAEHKMTMPDYMAAKFGDQVDLKYGSPFEQAVLNAGLVSAKHRPAGMPAPTMEDINKERLAIRGPDGASDAISARMLFPQVILETIRNYLMTDEGDFIDGYNSMVGMTENVNSPKVDQPYIDERANENVLGGPVAQMGEPETLVEITVGDKSYRIPTDSIGVTISDEAAQWTTLDLVNLAMTAHARKKRVRRVEQNIKSMVLGSTDNAVMTALPVKTAQSFDSTITAAGTITRKAWLKFLRDGYQTRSINGVMMSLDTYLKLEDVIYPQNFSMDPRQTSIGNTLMNMNLIPQRILLVGDDVLGANRVVGLDTRFAIRRMVNVAASYDAIERYVMRRATSFRVDSGEMSHRMYDEAWSVMDLTV